MAHTIDHFYGELHAKRGREALELRPFQDFVFRVVNTLDASPASFWRCRDAFADLTISRAALDYIECELLSGLAAEHYLPQLVLLDCDRFSLRLQLLSPGSPSTAVSATVEHRMMALVHGSAQLHRFEQPIPEPMDVFDPERKIMSLGISALSAGDVVECRAGVDCCKLAVDGPAVLFEMRSEPVYNFQWFYDSVTLAPTSILFVGPEDMRAELGLLTALNLGSPDVLPYIRSFLDHPNHFIRCSALKAIAGIDPENSSCHIDAALQDHHPQVRAAAAALRGKGVANGTDVAP